MNQALIPSLIKEEQLHAYPTDMSSWNQKKREIAKPFTNFLLNQQRDPPYQAGREVVANRKGHRKKQAENTGMVCRSW